MQVIRHDHIFTQINMWESLRDPLPLFSSDQPGTIKRHFPAFDFTEQFLPMPGVDRHKIRSWLGVIVPGQSDRPAMMDLWIGFYDHSSCRGTVPALFVWARQTDAGGKFFGFLPCP